MSAVGCLAVEKEKLGSQCAGRSFWDVTWILCTQDNPYAERATLSSKGLKAWTSCDPMRFVKDNEARQTARLLTTKRIPVQLDDDELGQSSLDLVGWELIEF